MTESKPGFIEGTALKTALLVEKFIEGRSLAEAEKQAKKSRTSSRRRKNLKLELASLGLLIVAIGSIGVNQYRSSQENSKVKIYTPDSSTVPNPSKIDVRLGKVESRLKTLGYRDVVTFEYGAVYNTLTNIRIEADTSDMLQFFAGQGVGPNEAQVYISILPKSPVTDEERYVMGNTVERGRSLMEPIYRREQPVNRGGIYIYPIFFDELESMIQANEPVVDKMRDQGSSRYLLALTDALNLQWLRTAYNVAESINSTKGLRPVRDLPQMTNLKKYEGVKPFTVTFYSPQEERVIK